MKMKKIVSVIKKLAVYIKRIAKEESESMDFYYQQYA